MTMYEGFGDDRLLETVAQPTFLPRHEMRGLRRDARVEQDLVFTNLEFLQQALAINEGPKLFYKEDYDSFERLTLLAVPLGHVGIHLHTMFVAINIQTSHPEANDERRMEATAYKFDASAKRICQYPVTKATLSKHGTYWQHDAEFGPFIQVRGGMVDVTCWDAYRLDLSTETHDKISTEAIRQRAMARQLANMLGRVSLDDQKIFSLFPSKL